MLALPGTFRVHDEGMQSTDAKGAYYDGRCSTAPVCEGDPHFPICVRIAAKISKEFSGNAGAECTRWTQEPSLIGVYVAAWC